MGPKAALVVPLALLLAALFGCSPKSARESSFDQFLSSHDANASIALRPISTEDGAISAYVDAELPGG